MTIFTKPSVEKKSEKVPLPLALEDPAEFHHAQGQFLTQPASEADAESMIFNRPPRVSCMKSFLLFLITLLVMGMGVLGGYTLYRMWMPNRVTHLHAFCDIPYIMGKNQTMPRFYPHSDELSMKTYPAETETENKLSPDIGMDDEFFREDIELDMSDEESYAKVNVPDFRDGRQGKYMHDFKQNQSAIIDISANRCFIMNLDRKTTLPPQSFLDLMNKMNSGYYNIDTDRVRRTMQIVFPNVRDMSLVSERIMNECIGKHTYMLEDFVSGVSKREAIDLPSSGKFAEFFGPNIVEYDILNVASIEALERAEKK